MSDYIPQPPVATARNSTLAIVSLISGILGWSFVPFLGSVVAIVTGHMAQSEIKKSLGQISGNGMAIAGLILGYLAIALGICALCAAIVLPLLGISLFGINYSRSGY